MIPLRSAEFTVGVRLFWDGRIEGEAHEPAVFSGFDELKKSLMHQAFTGEL